MPNCDFIILSVVIIINKSVIGIYNIIHIGK